MFPLFMTFKLLVFDFHLGPMGFSRDSLTYPTGSPPAGLLP